MTALMHYIIEGIENDRIKERIAMWRENINDEFKCSTCKEWLNREKQFQHILYPNNRSFISAPSCHTCLYSQLVNNAGDLFDCRCFYCGKIDTDGAGDYYTRWKSNKEYEITLCEDCREYKWVYPSYLEESCDCELNLPEEDACVICNQKKLYETEKELLFWCNKGEY